MVAHTGGNVFIWGIVYTMEMDTHTYKHNRHFLGGGVDFSNVCRGPCILRVLSALQFHVPNVFPPTPHTGAPPPEDIGTATSGYIPAYTKTSSSSATKAEQEAARLSAVLNPLAAKQVCSWYAEQGVYAESKGVYVCIMCVC